MGAGEADGLYIGLPTMATANAMYGRMQSAYRKLYASDAHPSLILSHGARHLSKKFTETVVIGSPPIDQRYGIEETASAYCSQWFTDNRKKALLADVGIGTIDQALISILPSRHQSLRLLGLQRKVLIVDEVHAYDPYMEHLLGVLLEAHARSGGSAILLSATIPYKKRRDLIHAFQAGLKGTTEKTVDSQKNGFPLLTQVGGDTIYTKEIPTRKEVEKSVALAFCHSRDEVLALIIRTVAEGQCVCWIRNTVKDARKTFHDLVGLGISVEKIDLFHSRFAMIDRARAEENVIAAFGKESGPLQREGRILIATQVVEQSLDLDFDVMISDLAPIDLLMQRAGRMHRHIRGDDGALKIASGSKDDRPPPVFTIFCPKFAETPESTWLSGDFAGSAAIYQNIGVLWRTQRVLQEKNGWKMPDDARELIESVYGEGTEYDAPEAFYDKVSKALGKDAAKTSMGHLNALILEKGYCREATKAGLWNEDEKIPTRISEENVEIALAVVENERLVPYAEEERYPWDWSLLSVSMRDWKKANYTAPAELQPLIDALKVENLRLKYSEIVIVEQRSNSAFLKNGKISNFYDPRLGWGAELNEEECN
jgi:CRISPR-associated endonuclease/helicase Cas3